MSNYSQYKSLELPTEPEHYSIGIFNKNAMVIDSELHKLDLKNESQDNLLATKEAFNEHTNNKENPHEVTKNQVGLGNADNTSDMDKPVSAAQQTAIDEAFYQSNYYTDAKIAALINGAPETLDTLKEISDALSENETVMEALDAAIGAKSNQTELDTHTGNGVIHVTQSDRDNWNTAKEHANSTHARTDATKVEKSDMNGNIKIDGTETTVYLHPSGTNPHGTTKADIGLANVENKSSATIRGELTKENVINALGYTPPTTNTTYSASTTIPKANGTASAGIETTYARGDHIHPLQTSVTGNAATASQINGTYTGSGGQQPPSYVTSGKTRFNMWNAFKGIINPAGEYMDVILMDNYTGSDVPYVTGIGVTKNNGNPRMFIANGAKGSTGNWAHQVEVITTENIANYQSTGIAYSDSEPTSLSTNMTWIGN